MKKGLISIEDKIFVAGHKGMAGSSIVRALARNGFKNIVTINRDQLDLLDFIQVRNWFAINKPSIVVLAAAKVGGIEANRTFPANFILDNLKIQNNVIENSWQNGVRRFLFLGSSCIYPKCSPQPIKEESLLSSYLEPTNEWYAIAKIAGLKLCQALRKQYGFDAITLMPTNLYGPGDNYHIQNSHVLPALIRRFHEAKIRGDKTVQCWGSGSPFREFMHVDDLGEACVFALNYWDPNNKNSPSDSNGNKLDFLNVGTGLDIQIRELAIKISKIIDYPGEIVWDKTKPDGTPKKQLDVSRLLKLGWSSKIDLDSGLENTINIFKDQIQSKKIRI